MGETARAFLVRAYDCDPVGHLNNAAYLRFVLEVDRGTTPLRRVTADHLREVEPGRTVVVEGLPMNLGDRIRADYRLLVDGVEAATVIVERADRHLGLPGPPPPPPGVFEIRRTVEWRDMGPDLVVRPATIAALAEDAGVRVSAAHGWPLSRCMEHGFAIVLRRNQITYGAPLALEDEVTVRTWFSDPRRSMATRHYELLRSDGEVVARLRSLYVWVDLERGRPIRIPEGFLADFSPNLAR